MSHSKSPLTATDLLAAATDLMKRGGYSETGPDLEDLLPAASARLFEDSNGIVAVFTYETWSDLRQNWTEAQSALVEAISRGLGPSDAKAWDGYLVLLTLGAPGPTARSEASTIRYDTRHVRKILGTAEEIKTPADVQAVLAPLLPLDLDTALEESRSVIDLLPDLLAEKGRDRGAVVALVDAFRNQEQLLARLHEYLESQ